MQDSNLALHPLTIVSTSFLSILLFLGDTEDLIDWIVDTMTVCKLQKMGGGVIDCSFSLIPNA